MSSFDDHKKFGALIQYNFFFFFLFFESDDGDDDNIK